MQRSHIVVRSSGSNVMSMLLVRRIDPGTAPVWCATGWPLPRVDRARPSLHVRAKAARSGVVVGGGVAEADVVATAPGLDRDLHPGER